MTATRAATTARRSHPHLLLVGTRPSGKRTSPTGRHPGPQTGESPTPSRTRSAPRPTPVSRLAGTQPRRRFSRNASTPSRPSSERKYPVDSADKLGQLGAQVGRRRPAQQLLRPGQRPRRAPDQRRRSTPPTAASSSVGRHRGGDQADLGGPAGRRRCRRSGTARRRPAGRSRGSTVAEITAGITPMRTSVKANVASCGADRQVGGGDQAQPAGPGRPGDPGHHRLRALPDRGQHVAEHPGRHASRWRTPRRSPSGRPRSRRPGRCGRARSPGPRRRRPPSASAGQQLGHQRRWRARCGCAGCPG